MKHNTFHTNKHLTFLFILLCCISLNSLANPKTSHDPLIFDDRPIAGQAQLPTWFKPNSLNLSNALNKAIKEGKSGIILYFGRKDCAYCKALLNDNWGDPSIAKFTQKHFNVIAINTPGNRIITDFNNKKWSESDFASRHKTHFTPSLLFYNKERQQVLKLPGYRPKYQFRAALEYVADSHYKHESFRKYLALAEASFNFGSNKLNENDIFRQPPYNLSNLDEILVVFFEYPNCHACDILHGHTLNNFSISAKLDQFYVVQLNSHLETPIITPGGLKTTSKKWAEQLNLTFAPSLIFFDKKGKEIIRIESVVQFHRLISVINFINSGEYKKHKTFLDWMQSKKMD